MILPFILEIAGAIFCVIGFSCGINNWKPWSIIIAISGIIIFAIGFVLGLKFIECG